jgi:ubiquinone/menaquinone biosynthesis C-methylase UbiE
MSAKASPPVVDYEGSNYKVDFWESQPRTYEDRTEHIALRRLVPSHGHRVVHLGAGFGRMTSELNGYDQVIVLDYSRTMLQDARSRLGTSERYIYVAADIYHLPLADGSCDCAVMERVLHHLTDVPAALAEIRRVLAPGAPFVMEFANKRNFKTILRYWRKGQTWSPFDREPVELGSFYYNFHPAYIADRLREAHFETRRRLAVSYFRMEVVKRIVPLSLLVLLDRLLQPTGQLAPFSPSVFTLNYASGDTPSAAVDGPPFKCLNCGGALRQTDSMLICEHGDGCWAIHDGVYDFKEMVTGR